MVDDNPYDVELTLRVLKKHNLINPVNVAKDGAEALDYIFSRGAYARRDIAGKPHFIILDLNLPKVDGLEVLRRVRSDERSKEIPIIVLVSSEEELNIIESYGLNVNSYIIMPIDFDKFVKAVSDIGLHWKLLKQSTPVSTWEEYEV